MENVFYSVLFYMMKKKLVKKNRHEKWKQRLQILEKRSSSEPDNLNKN